MKLPDDLILIPVSSPLFSENTGWSNSNSCQSQLFNIVGTHAGSDTVCMLDHNMIPGALSY